MTGRAPRLLFCLPRTGLSGGAKSVLEIANRLVDAGDRVDVFSFDGPPSWQRLRAGLLPARDLDAVPLGDYEFVLVSKAFLLPMVLPRLGSARAVFFCFDYESFHHAAGRTYADFMAECPSIAGLYKLPVPIIATSWSVQRLIRERAGRDAIYVPLGVDKAVFCRRPRAVVSDRQRVLLVGNYLMPYKGMRDGVEAMRRLSAQMPVELVIVTQEQRGRRLFDELPFPVEIHSGSTDADIAAVMRTCDVYCCTSWYEGLGLPALEAFCCGLPVVSTRTSGVTDYGIDGVNLLLARPNDPQDLSDKLRMVLGSDALRERLSGGGLQTMDAAYDWETAVVRFKEAMNEIDATYQGAGPVDAVHMQHLLDALETEGNLTPIAVLREFQQLARDLDALLGAMAMDGRPSSDAIAQLRVVRDGLRRQLQNPRAEYYDAFKMKYDLCQLALGLADSERFAECVGAVLERLGNRDYSPAAAFSAIRYPDA